MTSATALDAALTAHVAGLCVVPPLEDGSKAPMSRWKRYQQRRPDEAQVRSWYEREGRRGLGLVCGAISGNLEMLEFEGKAIAAGLQRRFRERATQAGLDELLDRILTGYAEHTPSGGYHLLYHCTGPVDGNLKLARRLATEEELAQEPQDKIKVLIETRGEGGYVITAPSNGGVHPTGGSWTMASGGFESIATVTPEERDALLDLARSFDEIPDGETRPPAEMPRLADSRPGDDFNARASWSEILVPHGWRQLFTASDGNEHWRRPGKSIGSSATVSERGQGVLYVFSSSTEFEQQHAYSKFAAHAILNHRGDFTAAAAELRARGYGTQPAPAEATATPVVEVVPAPVKKKSAWPDPPDAAAFHGLPDSFVWTVDAYTEGDPVAVLGQFLALYGVAVGDRPYLEVGAIRHSPRIFVGIVGRSAKARKGDSWAPVQRLMSEADESLGPRILGGFGSGEAMVHSVRDERYAEKDGRQILVDSGEKDRRLMVLETELTRLLVSVGREGSTVSQTVRDAWDGRPLRNLVKTSPASSTRHHIGFVGHSTGDELRERLNEDQIRNGFANRFIWLAVQRSKLLPIPPRFEGEHLEALVATIRERLREARRITRMSWSSAAREIWEADWYQALSQERPGRVGVLLERAEAQVLRLAMIYALTDASDTLELVHLQAARALWQYSERSVAYLWGGSTGDAVADRILSDLESGPLTTTDLMVETFSRHISARDLQTVLAKLESQGRVLRERIKTSGRPAERWGLSSQTDAK